MVHPGALTFASRLLPVNWTPSCTTHFKVALWYPDHQQGITPTTLQFYADNSHKSLTPWFPRFALAELFKMNRTGALLHCPGPPHLPHPSPTPKRRLCRLGFNYSIKAGITAQLGKAYIKVPLRSSAIAQHARARPNRYTYLQLQAAGKLGIATADAARQFCVSITC